MCRATAAVQSALAATAGLPPRQALMELPTGFVFDPRIEGAIRGWAFEDEQARAVLVPHLLMIGASMALPAPTTTDMHELFSLLATMVPFLAPQVNDR